MSRLRIFAGPNGSGKSTLFNQINGQFNTGAFINADQIEQELSKTGLLDLSSFDIHTTSKDFEDFKRTERADSLLKKARSEKLKVDVTLNENFIVDKGKESHSYESALVAMFLREQLLQKKKTFSYETVMSHRSKLEEIKETRVRGYKPYLYYVCTDDPLVNIQRVENRVDKGGHAVAEERIASRYQKSLSLLLEAIKLSYRSYLFDNSGTDMLLIAETFQSKLTIQSDRLPNWFNEHVLKYYQ